MSNESTNRVPYQTDISGRFIYLVTNESDRTVESAWSNFEEAKKECEQWEKMKPQKEFMVVELPINGSFLADEFHEWIELNDWQFNPVSFNGIIQYRWVNEAYSSQATTKELYEIFLSQK